MNSGTKSTPLLCIYDVREQSPAQQNTYSHLNPRHMVGNQARKIVSAIVDREIIVWGIPHAQLVSTLPVKVRANPSSIKCGSLPLALDTAFIGGYSVFLHETRLLHCCTCFPMSRDPPIPKGIVNTPLEGDISLELRNRTIRDSEDRGFERHTSQRVKMEGAEVNSVDFQVLCKVKPFSVRIGIASV